VAIPHRLQALRALLAGILLLAANPVRAEHPWLVVDAPNELESRVQHAFLEVRGHGGARRGSGHDVVIAIDVSESTLEDTEIDLDGDGPTGRSDPALIAWLERELGDAPLVERLRDRQDFEDSVLAAELEAARVLAERLDPARFRVAIVTFAEQARVLAPLGSSRPRLEQALRGLSQDFHMELAGTNFAAAVELAHQILRPDPDVADDRLRSIVFLSDGAPTRPIYGDRAQRYALTAAMAAALDGIHLYAFAIGPEAEAGLHVMERMAVWSGGRLETVSRPAQVVSRLRRLDLVGMAEVSVVNQTTGAEARALRTFPDGTFDGFVELAAGRNRVRFAARGRDDSVHQVERWVTYQPPSQSASQPPQVSMGPADSEAPAEQDDPVEELRRRTAEIEAWAELERSREQQRKELKLRVEEEGGL
jgi:Mg-chelatase subunit ChlD